MSIVKMNIKEMSIGERIEYRINSIVTGLIMIAVTWILTLISEVGELVIYFYAAGLFFVFFGAVTLLLEHRYLSRGLFLEDI